MNNAGLFQGGTRSYDVSGRILDIADSATGSLTITAATASMFLNFAGDDAFDLIGGGCLRAIAGSGGAEVQIDANGGGDAFVTLAILTGTISNGVLVDHMLVFNRAFA